MAPTGKRLEFDPSTLPWLDAYAGAVDAYIDGLPEQPDYDLRTKLVHWAQFGFAVFPGLVEHDLIDRYLADVDELFETRRGSTMVMVERVGVKHVRDCTPDEIAVRHKRVLDFHNASLAGKQIVLHPQIVSFLGHVFRDTVVAMQSLTFMHGTEQHLHQDFAFVVSQVPSHLAATWIALEDIDPDAGPLGYFPGSQTVPKFDWGNGLFMTTESSRSDEEFSDYLEQVCGELGLEERSFQARKGDVFVWHGALVHRGMPQRNPELSRKSIATHYSSLQGYPRDRRDVGVEPIHYRINGGVVYADPRWPEEEDSYGPGADMGRPRPTTRTRLRRLVRR